MVATAVMVVGHGLVLVYLWNGVEGYTSSLEYFFTKLWQASRDGAVKISANSHNHMRTSTHSAAAQSSEQQSTQAHTYKHI